MHNDPKELEQAREKLNSISPSFCMAKWMHSTLHLQVGKTHSCHLPPPHTIPLAELESNPDSLHNTSQKIEERTHMRNGERPKGCMSCWAIEDLKGDHYSDRHYRGQDYWVKPFYEKVLSLPQESDRINPSYLEVSFSSKCQFKCSYCGPTFSSSWQQELENKGPLFLAPEVEHHNLDWLYEQGLLPDLKKEKEQTPYKEAFWKWWPTLKDDLLVLRVTGGEPFLSEDTYSLLENLESNPAPHLELSINTNLGAPRELNQKYFDKINTLLEGGKIRSFILHTSIDSDGDAAEYIRHGLNVEKFYLEVDHYLKSVPKGKLGFMCTFNILSCWSFPSFLKKVVEIRKDWHWPTRTIDLDMPHLKWPEFLAANNLPPQSIDLVEKILQKAEVLNKWMRPSEILQLKRIKEWIQTGRNDSHIQRQHLQNFLKLHDQRRQTNYGETFPSISDIF